MTSEQLVRWMNDAELTAAQVADHVGLDADTVFSQCFSPNSVSAEFEAALREAFPNDLDLMRLLSACPHCWDGLVDSDDEYNEPVYCQRCAQGLRLELAHIQGQIDKLNFAINDAANPNTWHELHLSRLRLDCEKCKGLRTKTERKLTELEAA